MDHLPRVIVLNTAQEFHQFKKRVQPYILGTDTTPKDLVETLWEAFFDEETFDEAILSAICDIGAKEQYKNRAFGGTIADPLHDFAHVIDDQVRMHKLYGEHGTLPYNIQLDDSGVVVLKRDDDMIEIQKGFGKMNLVADEVDQDW